jgi:hypothetical protein
MNYDHHNPNAEALMDRWEAQREVQNLMGRMTSAYVVKKEAEILDSYWSAQDDICLGVNNGYFNGRAAVASYYDSLVERNRLTAELIQKKFPDQLSQLPEDKLYGIGTMEYKPLDTPLVEVADDGETAKGIWCLRGNHSRLTPAGPLGYWEWGWMTADFRKENGQWKIWHLLQIDELLHLCGSKAVGEPNQYPVDEVFLPIADFKPAEPNVPMEVRPLYAADRPFTPPPRLPEPYDTFANTFSYGI